MFHPRRSFVCSVLCLLWTSAFCCALQTGEGPGQPVRGIRVNPRASAATGQSFAKRKDYAIFFAGNLYDSWQPLTNPIPDAQALQHELEQNYGFETELVQNPTLEDVLRVLSEWRTRQFGEQDQLLIFFAGHGVFDDATREGFLVTRDSDIHDFSRSHYLPYSRLRDLIDSLPAKHVFLVVDACFSGTLDRRIAESGNRGEDQYALLTLPELVTRKARFTTREFLTSGGKEYVPDGAPGHHSPFTAHLLAALRTYGGSRGYLTVNSILADVEAVKPEPVWGDWGRNEPGSEFLFIPKELKSRLANPSDALFARHPNRAPDLEVADVVPRRSVAVFGFKNMTQRAESNWLSGALAVALAGELAQGGQLRAISDDEVARLKSDLRLGESNSYAPAVLRQIYDNSGSDYVVSGSYIDLDQQLRLNINLQDTFRGDVIAVEESGPESELISMIARAGAELRYKLSAGSQASTQGPALLPGDPQAAKLYAEGRQKMQMYDAVAAQKLLDRSLVIEPTFAPAHYELAGVWSFMGYDHKAQEEAKKAFDLSSGLPREQRLLIEARYWSTVPNWDKSIDTFRSLWTLYPDNLDYGLQLAEAQVSAEHGRQALNTVEALRKLPSPLSDDPRIDIEESRAAMAVSDFSRQKEASVRAITKAQQLGARQLEVQALWCQSVALQSLGDNEHALQAYTRGANLAQQFGNQELQARFLTGVGNVEFDEGKYNEALPVRQEALKLATASGSKRDLSGALANVAGLLYQSGDLSGARNYYQRAVEVSREIQDKAGIALSEFNLASILQTDGDYDAAKRSFDAARQDYRELKDEATAALATASIAQILYSQGDLHGAERMLRDALQTARSLNIKTAVASFLTSLGDVLVAEGHSSEAHDDYSESLRLRGELGEGGSSASTKLSLASLLSEEGELRTAERFSREALAEFRSERDTDNEALASAVLGFVLLDEDKNDEAERVIAQARQIRILDRVAAVRFHIVSAAVLGGKEPSRAIKQLNAVAAQARQLGLAPWQLQAELVQAELLKMHGDLESAHADFVLISKEASDRGLESLAAKASRELK